MLGIARTVQIAGWQTAGELNPRQVGSASTNASVTYTATSPMVTSTSTFEFGTASGYSSTEPGRLTATGGTRDYLDFGTGDFTIEWWHNIGSGSARGSEFLTNNNTSGGFGCRYAREYGTDQLGSANPKYFNVFARGQADLDYWTMPADWPLNTWAFMVLQRRSATMQLWVDGVLMPRSNGPSGSAATRNFLSGTDITIMGDNGGGGPGPFYIDEFCVTKGFARYLNDDPVPVPTAPFTVDTYTNQLMHMDGSNGGTTFTNATS
jgi:hypothetical protein